MKTIIIYLLLAVLMYGTEGPEKVFFASAFALFFGYNLAMIGGDLYKEKNHK